MSSEAAKAEAFIARLSANPALSDLNPLQREEQILQFLHANSRQLYPTLASGNFFPGSDWQRIRSLLIGALVKTTDSRLVPLIQDIVNDTLDFSFVPFLRQQSMPPGKVKEELLKLLQANLSNFEVRRELIGPLNVIKYKGDEKYIEQIFKRKEYIHFETTKVQRLKMGKEELKNLIRTSLLLRAVVFSFSSSGASTESRAGLLPQASAEKITEALKTRCVSMPEQVHRSAVNSCVSFLDNRYIEATARLTAVFASMYRNYRGTIKIDRGADTQDKSWLNTARRNFKFFGYDIKLLDELYKIAAENGW